MVGICKEGGLVETVQLIVRTFLTESRGRAHYRFWRLQRVGRSMLVIQQEYLSDVPVSYASHYLNFVQCICDSASREHHAASWTRWGYGFICRIWYYLNPATATLSNGFLLQQMRPVGFPAGRSSYRCLKLKLIVRLMSWTRRRSYGRRWWWTLTILSEIEPTSCHIFWRW